MEPTKKSPGLLIHETLAQGYLLYMLAIVIGVSLDLYDPLRFSFPLEQPLGMLLILLGTGLVFWAQYSSGRSAEKRQADQGTNAICKDHFCVGPYVFTRSPTQYGLALLVFGLSLIYGMTYLLITGIVALLVGRFVIIRKEEQHLAEKYGQAYLDYKKHVKF